MKKLCRGLGQSGTGANRMEDPGAEAPYQLPALAPADPQAPRPATNTHLLSTRGRPDVYRVSPETQALGQSF
jgi:hypothetical protein